MRPVLALLIVLGAPSFAAATPRQTEASASAGDSDDDEGSAAPVGGVSDHDAYPRVRFGVRGGVMGGLVHAAVASDVSLRVGAQLTEWFGVTYVVRGLFGVTYEPGPLERALLLHVSAVEAEFTIVDRVQLGLGPAFFIGAMGLSGYIGGGGQARLWYTWGGTGEGTRQGFSLGPFVIVGTIDGGPLVWLGASAGWETF